VEVVVLDDAAGGAVLVADAVVALLERKPGAVLGLATGDSPQPIYDELARRRALGEVRFAQAQAFLLDEYVGLAPGHPQAYRAVIDAAFTHRLDLAPGAVHAPDVHAVDLSAACEAYEHEIAAAGGIDVQLLGIGADGHVGFNEPTSSLGSRTRIKTLTERTRRDNARFFGSLEEVPRHVVTQGIGTILDARHVVLVATGSGKADPVARAVEGPVTAMVPASALQLHPHATVVLDGAAASKLTLLHYYRDVWAAKPEWQGI
jgi:glucosamine-6-phosphate deaminase